MSQSGTSRASSSRALSLRRKFGIALRLGLVLLPLLLLLGGVIWLFSSVLGLTQQGITMLPMQRPKELVLDPAHQLSEGQRQLLSRQVASLNETMQADWVLVLLPQLDPRQTQAVAEKLFSRWQLGHHSLNQRGALLLVTTRPQKAALVLGKDLEHSFSNRIQQLAAGHLGDFLQEQMLRLYLENKLLPEGLSAALQFVNVQFNPTIHLAALPSLSMQPFRHPVLPAHPLQSSLVLPPSDR